MGLLDKIFGGLDVASLGYQLGGAIADLDPFGFNKAPSLPARPGAGGAGHSQGAPPSSTIGEVLGGATGMWDDYSNQFPLTTTNGGGRRALIPYSGGMIPSGYRVANRPARAPSSGYPGGVYLVPRRSMNPLNPKALMRAERRLNSFSKWVKRHFKIAASAPKRRKVGGRRRK